MVCFPHGKYREVRDSSKQPRRFSKKSFIHYYTHLVTPRDTAEDNTFIVIENPPDHHKKNNRPLRRSGLLRIESNRVRLQFRTGSNQSLTGGITFEFREVLDETSGQILSFNFPIGSISISIARIEDIFVHTRQLSRNNEVEIRNNLCRSFVDRAIENSIDNTTSIADRDTFARTVPTGVHPNKP